MASSTVLVIMIVIVCATFMIAVMNWRDSNSANSHPLEQELFRLQQNVESKRNELKNLIQSSGHIDDSPQDPQQTPEDPIHRVNAPVVKDLSHPFVGTETYKLPGGSEHRILTLSDTDFENVKISEMMSWYGEADGGNTCAGDFGNQLVNRWRATRKSYCASTGFIDGAEVGSSQAIDSSIDCFPVRQTRHHGVCDNMCLMKDVSINTGIFGKDTAVDGAVKEYVKTKHMKMPYVKYPKGFVRSTCKPTPNNWDRKFLPGWNAEVTVDATEIVPKQNIGKLKLLDMCENRTKICSLLLSMHTLVTADVLRSSLSNVSIEYLSGQQQPTPKSTHTSAYIRL